jgi:uncharacterized protein
MAIRRNEGRLRRRLLFCRLSQSRRSASQKSGFLRVTEPAAIVTTTWVLTEVADAFAASTARDRIAGFVAALDGDVNTKIVPATQALFHRGLDRYAARPDKDWTLTDCISFVVMEEEGITDALTGDQHFVQAGFEILLST